MGTATKYQNARTDRVSSAGGAVRVTLSSGTGQGNGGTSLPCRGCYVSCEETNSEIVKMNIDTAASATLGVTLAQNVVGANASAIANPLYVPIDDVSKLYFYSADSNAIIDIMYLKG